MPKEGTFTRRRLSVIELMVPAVLVLRPIGMLPWLAATSWCLDQVSCGLHVASALIANGTDSTPIILGEGIVAPGGVSLHRAAIALWDLANEKMGNGAPGRWSGLPSPPMSFSRGIYIWSAFYPGTGNSPGTGFLPPWSPPCTSWPPA